MMSSQIHMNGNDLPGGGSFPHTSLDASPEDSIIILPQNNGAEVNGDVENDGMRTDDMAQQMQWSMVEIHDSFGADMSLEEAIGTTKILMRENKELKELISQLNSSVERARNVMIDQKDKAIKEREDKAAQYEQARNTVTTLRNQLDDRDKLIAELQTQAEEFRHWREEERATPSMQGHITQINADVSEKAAEVQRIQQQYTAVEETVASYAEQLQALKVDKIEHSETIMKLQRTIDLLKVEKQDLVAMNNELETDCDRYRKQDELTERKRRVIDNNDFVVVTEEDTAEDGDEIQTAAAAVAALDLEDKEDEDEGENAPLMSLATSNLMSELLVQMQVERSQNDELMKRLTEANVKIEALQKHVDEQKHQSEVTQDALVQSMEHQRAAEHLQQQVQELQKEQASKPENAEALNTVRAQAMSLLGELREKTTQLTAAEENCSHFKERCRQSEERLRLLQEEADGQRGKDNALIQTLRSTVTALEEDLQREREKNNMKARKTKEIHQQFDKLANDYKKVMDAFDLQEKKLKDFQDQNAALRNQRGQGNLDPDRQEENDLQQARFLSLEESLANKERLIKQMERDVHEATDLANKSAVYQTQAELYKKDFEDEKTEGEQLKGVNGQLVEQLQQRDQMIRQLQEQLDAGIARQLQYGPQQGATAQNRVMMQSVPVPQQTSPYPTQATDHIPVRYDYATDGSEVDGSAPGAEGPMPPPGQASPLPPGTHNPFMPPVMPLQNPSGVATPMPAHNKAGISDAQLDANGTYWCAHCPPDRCFRTQDENAMYRHNFDVHKIYD